MTEDLILEVRDVVKNFPGVRALDGVQFKLRTGEVHALVGENGAGKSTLIHILGGVYRADQGEILLEGRPVQFDSPHQAAQNGISVVYQELSLSPNLSVAENIYANRQPRKRFNLVDWNRLNRDTAGMLERFELSISPKTLVKSLSVAGQQVVEILKAISRGPKVLILDEPTSSLTQMETSLLFENIQQLKAQGVSFVYISHHLPEIFEVADRVTVFRDGRYIDTRRIDQVDEEQVVKLMVGRDLVDMYGTHLRESDDEFFQLDNVKRGTEFCDISLSLRRGEILGVAGLVGAGRTELARGIFGLEPFDGGRIILEGKPITVRSSREAIQHGIAYLTEDRKNLGLFLKMSIREDIIAPELKRFSGRAGLMKERSISAFAEKSRRQFNIITPSIIQKVRNLSGGNQQKVLLSMWVGVGPKLLIMDEPTRGVDVGARREIYQLMRELAGSGVGIIMVSSDLPEVLGVSDRILVMRQGRLVGEFTSSEATEEKVIACATGLGAMACQV